MEQTRTTREASPRRRHKRRRNPRFLLLMAVVAVLGVVLVRGALGSDAAEDGETLPIHDLTEGQEVQQPDQQPGQMPEDPDVIEPEEPVIPEEPAVSADDWNLILANPWTKLPDGYTPTLTKLSNGHAVDERAYPDLQQMMDDCRAAGYKPLICSSYRTWEKQQSLFDRKIQRLIDEHGYSREVAEVEAAKVVAVPGTSEHQTGLALDIVDESYQVLDDAQENTPAQQWLMEHSWEYGFVLRFPSDKSDVTGIIYEPWHYRYVGKEAAAAIHDQGICLEEYLEQLTA